MARRRARRRRQMPRPTGGSGARGFDHAADTPANDPSALAEFHLTQYTLAPAIVRPSTSENLVVVNYHAKQLDAALLRTNHLAPYQDFGNGVALCRQAP